MKSVHFLDFHIFTFYIVFDCFFLFFFFLFLKRNGSSYKEDGSMQPNMNSILGMCIGGTFDLMNIFSQIWLMSVLWSWVQFGKLRNFWFCFHLVVWGINFKWSVLRKQSESVFFFSAFAWSRVSYQKPCTSIWVHIPILAGKQRYAIFLSNKILDYRSNDSLRGVFRCA